MKKGILLIAAAAFALGSNNASAAAPNWYNFQGVCYSQNATVTVQFDIVNKNNVVIYSETHSGVQTNASGIFTCHVGEGEAIDGAMPSTPELTAGGLVLVTSVNGLEVSRAAFGAVPYASQAAAVGEYDAQDITNLGAWVEELSESVTGYDDQIADIWNTLQPVAGILPGYTKMVQEVATNTEAIANAEQTLVELSPAVKGNTAAIAKLQEDVNINIDGIANAEQTLVELAPAVKGNTAAIAKLQEDVNINIEGIANAEQTLIELTEANMANTAAIAKLEANSVTSADMDNFSENIEMALKAYVTTEDLDASMANFQENIENALKAYVTTEDLEIDMNNFQENIEMALKAYVTTEDLDASMTNFQENIEKALEAYVTTEDLDASMANFQENIQKSLEAYVTTEDLDASMNNFQENIDLRLTSLETEQAGKNENYEKSIESLNGEIENLQNSVVELLSLIEANQAQSNEVTKTVMGLVDDVDTLQTKVEALENK